MGNLEAYYEDFGILFSNKLSNFDADLRSLHVFLIGVKCMSNPLNLSRGYHLGPRILKTHF